jgi:hypothetical protein
MMYDRMTASPGSTFTESDQEYQERMAEKRRLQAVNNWEQSWAWKFDISPQPPPRPPSRARPRTSPFATGEANSRFKCFTLFLQMILYYINVLTDGVVLLFYAEYGHDYRKINKVHVYVITRASDV